MTPVGLLQTEVVGPHVETSVQRNAHQICCGCIFVTYISKEAYRTMYDSIVKIQKKRFEELRMTTGDETAASSYTGGKPSPEIISYHPTQEEEEILEEEDDTQFLESLKGYKYGLSDRLASVFGIPLAVALLMHSALVVFWGIWKMQITISQGNNLWYTIQAFAISVFNILFGILAMSGIAFRSVVCLVIARAAVQAHITVAGVTVLVGFLGTSLIALGLVDPEEMETLPAISEICLSLLTCLGACIFTVGLYKSILAVIVVGGNGYEKKCWMKLLHER